MGRQQIAIPILRWHSVAEVFPRLWKEAADAVVEPVDLGVPTGGDWDEHDLTDTLWILLRVGQRQR